MAIRDVRQIEFRPIALVGQKSDLVGCRRVLREQAAVRSEAGQLEFARAVTQTVTAIYWQKVAETHGISLPLRLPPAPTSQIEDSRLESYAAVCAGLEISGAFFQIGELYTELLPAAFRSRHGVYYTPPALVNRLLDLLESQAVDWTKVRVLDPACGGAAFAAYLARRMLAANAHLSAEERLRDLSVRLQGLDLDPFAAWLSAVLVDVVCLPVMKQARRRVDGIIHHADMLAQRSEDLGMFDLIVGNPPYGRTTLTATGRERFSRSLYGHANLYGLFADLAVRLTNPGGLIAYVTPTSFLGGQYFKNLRRLLENETELRHVSFVTDRAEVFSGVLQETMLTIFERPSAPVGKRSAKWKTDVELVRIENRDTARPERLATVQHALADGEPWLLPRSAAQVPLVRQLRRMPARMFDYGYRVATGQLVWNRHKRQFRDRLEANCHPVLWAEAVRPDGSFRFQAEGREHRPFLCVETAQDHLLNFEPCVLIQRTTSKEQTRRLIAAVVSNDFAAEHDGYFVENHLNMLVATTTASMPLWLMAALLNSPSVDQAFRCISGSVAVSAYELENLPLPDPAQLLTAVRAARLSRGGDAFDRLVARFYGRK